MKKVDASRGLKLNAARREVSDRILDVLYTTDDLAVHELILEYLVNTQEELVLARLERTLVKWKRKQGASG